MYGAEDLEEDLRIDVEEDLKMWKRISRIDLIDPRARALERKQDPHTSKILMRQSRSSCEIPCTMLHCD
jgi:hypothetical protein